MIPSNFDVDFIDGAYWTMAYEFKFAVIFFGVLLLRRTVWRKAVILIWLGAAICLGAFQSVVPTKLLFLVRGIFITDFIHTFAGGLAIAWLRSGGAFYKSLFLLCFINHYCWYGFDIGTGLFFLLTTIFLVALPALERIPLNEGIYKPFKVIAAISYPLYLLHQMIGFGIIKIFTEIGVTNEFMLLIPFGVSLALAYGVHRFIEVPLARTDFFGRVALYCK